MNNYDNIIELFEMFKEIKSLEQYIDITNLGSIFFIIKLNY